MNRVAAVLIVLPGLMGDRAASQELPGTAPWGDRGSTDEAAAAMVEGLHRFLDRQTASSVGRRARHWDRDTSSPEAYARSVEPNRGRLGRIVGAVDPRVAPVAMHLAGSTEAPAELARAEGFRVLAVRWDVYADVQAEGLLLEPEGEAIADVVAMADCDVTPEAFVGLAEGLPPGSQVARLLAEAGCRVVVPVLLDRSTTSSGNPDVAMTNLSHREWIWRQGFEAGRHPIGYEVDAVRAAVDWFCRDGAPGVPIGVVGHGEGGMIALYSAALDTRIDGAWVAGAFGDRRGVWGEPIDRDVWGLLDEFGDAEIASLIAPRALAVEPCGGPTVDGPPPPVDGRSQAASGRIEPIGVREAVEEWERLRGLLGELKTPSLSIGPVDADGRPLNAGDHARGAFLDALLGRRVGRPEPAEPRWISTSPPPDPVARMGRWVRALQGHTQASIRTSELRRYDLWSEADASSPESWASSTSPFRETFREEVIGSIPEASEPLEPRSVKVLDEPGFEGYAVEIPVLPDVVASGILLLPKDLRDGERRPVVVCQHGLEGTPDPIVIPGVESPYNSYGAALADRGYVVYAPQNPYIGVDRFRQLQRKAHPLKASLFSIIVRQHERTLEWLRTLPNVDADRIALYGLSYGGKTAMRVPALVDGYCLSICSADFNEWVVKCTDLDRRLSYMYTIEYDMYEWDLASGYNYAEMAGLIAPRPFMVERGHADGVAPDEWVAYEYAKVRRLYDALGIGDRSEITFFNGGHLIQGEATFDFLTRHLDWPRGRTDSE
ncbi:alpha/beta hydrolase family protein [Tautonia plasticadhaerens]|uniref:Alpha/beta hydrolase family protein n=1 Tax=Tautonia plasticadhaerens TaxID=2527974 RepID=A0A518H4L1_9BACT|nr:dienelactone hydrolase family protein [Tautonia plasticadhaerens]QDV35774.1 Alpha/beta hydrolase family protein [Tautonia plasticadhaerens]